MIEYSTKQKIDTTPPAEIAASIPREYLDGCTLFPDRFGKISHKHICIQHDIDYWTKRTAVAKFKSDWLWFVGINKTHAINTTRWRVAAFVSTIVGLIALTTVGWFFWKTRSRWDKMTRSENENI